MPAPKSKRKAYRRTRHRVNVEVDRVLWDAFDKALEERARQFSVQTNTEFTKNFHEWLRAKMKETISAYR